MSNPQLERLELRAEIDALLARLRRWADSARQWQAAEVCARMVQRLLERAESILARLEAPLVVATLGGTGTGKSALVNAIVGEEVVPVGRHRPTTNRPVLVCRPGLAVESLGIDPQCVDVVRRDLPALADVVLIDCPDPDTTEQGEELSRTGAAAPRWYEPPATGSQDGADAQSNLSRLRAILPHCDVLLVTATQQKYRSGCVSEELAAAAAGARMVFVQTHAALDDDIRPDWQQLLQRDYSVERIFRVDSLAALEAARNGRQPESDFAELRNLLLHELSRTAAVRIRRANLLDLLAEVLARCQSRLEAPRAALDRLKQALAEQRQQLLGKALRQINADLLANRRLLESSLLDSAVSRWGLSPFSLVLRVYQNLGNLLSGALLWRMRTPAQMVLWGVMEGARRLRGWLEQHQAQDGMVIAAAWCDEAAVSRSSLILEGYAEEAGLPTDCLSPQVTQREAAEAIQTVAQTLGQQVRHALDRLAQRRCRFVFRAPFEMLTVGMIVLVLARLAKNFFYDSWLAEQTTPIYGLQIYLLAGFWLVLWCVLLVWAFTWWLRLGLRRTINRLAADWQASEAGQKLFADLEKHCRQAQELTAELDHLAEQVAELRKQQPVVAKWLAQLRR